MLDMLIGFLGEVIGWLILAAVAALILAAVMGGALSDGGKNPNDYCVSPPGQWSLCSDR